ncbi:MAG TPA: hypothetical protein VF177_08785 [Anaerolineae bacterium]
MSATKKDNSPYNGDPQAGQSERSEFSAPSGSLKSGRLVLASAVTQMKLRANPLLDDLYQAHFKRQTPHVWLHENTVTIQFRRIGFLDGLTNLSSSLAEISLNGSIPWEIEFRKGVSHLDADLRQLQMHSLDMLSGANRIRLILSRPSGTAYIYISGGISRGTILVPADAGVSLRISGGATNLVFDNQRFGAIGGETGLQSPDFKSATGRLDICIAGGASNLTINRES